MRALLCLLLSSFAVISAQADEGLRLLEGPQKSLELRLGMIEAEQESLQISTFIMRDDSSSEALLSALVRAAERGVKVQLMLDAFGARQTFSDNQQALLALLHRSGGEVKLYHPIGFGDVLRHPFHLLRRMHDKIFMGSSSVVLGDRNLADEYFGLKQGEGMHNTFSVDVLLKSQAEQSQIKQYFNKVWGSSHVKAWSPPAKSITSSYQPKLSQRVQALGADAQEKVSMFKSFEAGVEEADEVEFLHDEVDRRLFGKAMIQPKERTSYSKLLKMIRESEKSVSIVNAYVLLDKEMMQALKEAVQRGVRVEIFTNSYESAETKWVTLAFEKQLKKVQELGIHVYKFDAGHSLHAKTAVVDGLKSYIGSFNLDPRSLKLNLESGIFVKGQNLAQKLEKFTEKVRMRSKPWSSFEVTRVKSCAHALFNLTLPLIRSQLR